MAFSRKKPNGGLRTYFLENRYWNFKVFYFIPGNSSRKNKALPQKLPKIVLRPSKLLRPKIKPRSWKFHMIFSFWITTETYMLFLINPWKFHLHPPPLVWFFSGIAEWQVLRWYTCLAIFVDIGYVVLTF